MKIILTILLLLISTPVWATTYYVSKTASNGYAVGSNSNSCVQAQNKATPKNTIDGSSSSVMDACVVGGDTVIVNEGTYTNQITNPPAGTAGAYTIIKADPASSRPLLRPDGTATQRGFYCDNGSACSYIRLEGFDIGDAYNSVKLTTTGTTYPHHLQFVNNLMHDTRSTNFETTTSNTGEIGGDHLIQGNEFYNTGIYYPDDNAGATYSPGHNTIYNPGNRTIVERNVFHNIHNGVGIWHSNKYLYDVIVRYNVFYDIGLTLVDTWQVGASGYQPIHMSSGGGRHRIYGNIIYDSGDTANFRAININPQFGKTTITDIQVYNNSIYNIKHSSAFGIRVSANAQVAGSVIVKNNIVIPVLGTAIADQSGLSAMIQTSNRTTGTASAIWNSPSTGDLTLIAGSAAIDAGTSCTNTYNGSSCDQGAYEIPVFASCEVINGSETKVRVRFVNNPHPPMLPASSVTGVTVRKNSSNNVVVSSARVGDNDYDFTITNSYVGGDTVDISIVVASTNLTDSALIGNSLNQSFLTTLTNQSCTNNAGAAPSHTYTQASFEHHYWRGTEAAPVILPYGYASTGAAENYVTFPVPVGGKIRTRFAITCGGGANCPASAFYPYFSTGGGYALITNTFTTNDIKLCGVDESDDMPANGEATTNQLSTAGTFVAGGVLFTANAVPSILGLNDGYKTELEYCFAFDTDASGIYTIRLYLQDGTALNTYTVTPSLSIQPSAAGAQ